MIFKEVDLRDQITGVKGQSYYENYKDKLKINKHSVVFDKDFRFELHYCSKDGYITLSFKIDDVLNHIIGWYAEHTYNYKPKYILEDILTYIASYIQEV